MAATTTAEPDHAAATAPAHPLHGYLVTIEDGTPDAEVVGYVVAAEHAAEASGMALRLHGDELPVQTTIAKRIRGLAIIPPMTLVNQQQLLNELDIQ